MFACCLGGCDGGGKPVEIVYDRPAEYDIPIQIKRVAIAEFGGMSDADKRWGDLASDMLASRLDEYNRKYSRYELVDRKRLKAIMDERDLQIAIADASSAAKVGKLANVSALIYGNVKVQARDEHGTKTVFDPINQTTKQVPYVHRYCMAAVNFTMDDVETGKTICTVTATRDYDSDKKTRSGGATFARAMGIGIDDKDPIDQVCGKLIEQCVVEFIGKISPHQEKLEVKLESGKSKLVGVGNKLAGEGEYRDALEYYEKALAEEPRDHGALFNAGVMCEVQGDRKRALEYYEKALKVKDDCEKCIQARRRVRQENPPAAASPK